MIFDITIQQNNGITMAVENGKPVYNIDVVNGNADLQLMLLPVKENLLIDVAVGMPGPIGPQGPAADINGGYF